MSDGTTPSTPSTPNGQGASSGASPETVPDEMVKQQDLRNLQSTYDRRIAQLEADLQRERQQNQSLTGKVVEDMAPAEKLAFENEQLRAEMERIRQAQQEQQAREAMANAFGVDASVLANASTPDQMAANIRAAIAAQTAPAAPVAPTETPTPPGPSGATPATPPAPKTPDQIRQTAFEDGDAGSFASSFMPWNEQRE